MRVSAVIRAHDEYHDVAKHDVEAHAHRDPEGSEEGNRGRLPGAGSASRLSRPHKAKQMGRDAALECPGRG